MNLLTYIGKLVSSCYVLQGMAVWKVSCPVWSLPLHTKQVQVAPVATEGLSWGGLRQWAYMCLRPLELLIQYHARFISYSRCRVEVLRGAPGAVRENLKQYNRPHNDQYWLRQDGAYPSPRVDPVQRSRFNVVGLSVCPSVCNAVSKLILVVVFATISRAHCNVNGHTEYSAVGLSVCMSFCRASLRLSVA